MPFWGRKRTKEEAVASLIQELALAAEESTDKFVRFDITQEQRIAILWEWLAFYIHFVDRIWAMRAANNPEFRAKLEDQSLGDQLFDSPVALLARKYAGVTGQQADEYIDRVKSEVIVPRSKEYGFWEFRGDDLLDGAYEFSKKLLAVAGVGDHEGSRQVILVILTQAMKRHDFLKLQRDVVQAL